MSIISFNVFSIEVEGGFGYKFKEKIDTSKLDFLGKTKEGGEKFKFTPNKPYGNLTKYHVYTTPTSKSIYKIEAIGSFQTKGDCTKELSALELALEGKYGAKNKDVAAAISRVPMIRLGGNGKRIVGICMTFVKPYKLTLAYMDDSETETAKREQAVITNKSRDTGGL